jgi:quercetin dioxygenase-like cupin family protein
MKKSLQQVSVFVIVAALVGLFAVRTLAADQASGFSRKVLQEADLSAPGRHGTIALIEFAVGGAAARHTHPGEELGYVIEGTFQLEIDGKAPQVIKAGETFIIPAGVIHTGRNIGTTPAKLVSSYFIEKGQPLATPAK